MRSMYIYIYIYIYIYACICVCMCLCVSVCVLILDVFSKFISRDMISKAIFFEESILQLSNVVNFVAS